MGNRWSDEDLDQFHTEFKAFVREFEMHTAQDIERDNVNAAAVRKIAENTSDLIAAWESAQSVVRAGATLGRFAKWLASLAVIGAIFKWLSTQ